MNLQAIAEWIGGIVAQLEAAGLVTLADRGYQGSTYARIPSWRIPRKLRCCP